MFIQFKQYWEDVAGLAGGLLVWNTGRSIGQACALFTDKEGLLAVPSTIITAVGTKIFDREPRFPHTTPEGWRENTAWSRLLDKGWDLEVVRGLLEAQVCGCISVLSARWLISLRRWKGPCLQTSPLILFLQLRATRGESRRGAVTYFRYLAIAPKAHW
jgi:hypothetical protein